MLSLAEEKWLLEQYHEYVGVLVKNDVPLEQLCGVNGFIDLILSQTRLARDTQPVSRSCGCA